MVWMIAKTSFHYAGQQHAGDRFEATDAHARLLRLREQAEVERVEPRCALLQPSPAIVTPSETPAATRRRRRSSRADQRASADYETKDAA